MTEESEFERRRREFVPDPNFLGSGRKSNRIKYRDGQGNVIAPDPEAPPWETETWATDQVLDKLHAKTPLSPGIAQAAFDEGFITQTEHDYVSSVYDEGPRLTRFERVLRYQDHRGAVMNTIGLMETLSGYRFLVAASSAVTEGLKDPDNGLRIGGFGLAWSTEEWSKAVRGRRTFQDVLAKGGNEGGGTMALGIGMDVLLDPSTWLTFGVGAGTRMTIEGGSAASKVLARNVFKRGGKEAADAALRGGQQTVTRWGELVMKEAARDFLKDHTKTMYRKFGVKNADNILPEHVSRLLDDVTMRGKLAEHAVENYEKYGTAVLEAQRKMSKGPLSKLNPIYLPKKAAGGWTPNSLIYRAKFDQGPAGMFQETASLWAKEGTFGLVGAAAGGLAIGAHLGPVGMALGGVAGGVAAHLGPSLRHGEVSGSALKALDGLNKIAAEKLSRDMVPLGLRTATRVTEFTTAVAHGGIQRFRNIFTSAIERIPGEDRFFAQAMIDETAEKSAAAAFTVRKFFDQKFDRPTLGGTISRRLSIGERQLISHHLEDAAKHPIPSWMKPAADFAEDQFDDIFELEREMLIGGDKLEDYVTHIYSSSMFNNVVDFLRNERPGPSTVTAESLASRVSNPFALHRKIATLDDALAHFGPDNVELDIARILTQRWSVSNRMRAKKSLAFHMMDKYKIGGMANSLIMEFGAQRRLLKTIKYYRDYVDTGAPASASKAQYDTLDRLAAQIAEHDMKILGRRGREFLSGKRGEREMGLKPARAGKRALPRRGEGSQVTEVVESEGKLVQQTEVLPRPEGGKDILSKNDWFQKHPNRDELKSIRDDRLHKSTVHNRGMLRILSKDGIGVKYDKMTTGEAQFLIDFLKAHVSPAELFNARTGKFMPRGWFNPEGMINVQFSYGKMKRRGQFFDEAEVEPRGAFEPRDAFVEAPVGVSWKALDEVNIADPADRARRATARESAWKTAEISRKLRRSRRVARELERIRRPAVRKVTPYDKKIEPRSSEQKELARSLRDAVKSIHKKSGAKGVAEWLSDVAEDQSLRTVLKRISKYLDDTDIDEFNVGLGSGVADYKDVLGSGDPRAKLTVKLQSTLGDYNRARVGGYTVETIAHEFVHAATMKQLDRGMRDSNRGIKSSMSFAYNDLNKIIRAVKERSLIGTEELRYSLKDPHELVAMALTNPIAQKELDSIIIDGESGWSKFISTLVKMITGRSDAKLKTALTEVLRIADETVGLKKSGEFLHGDLDYFARSRATEIEALQLKKKSIQRSIDATQTIISSLEGFVKVFGSEPSYQRNIKRLKKAVKQLEWELYLAKTDIVELENPARTNLLKSLKRRLEGALEQRALAVKDVEAARKRLEKYSNPSKSAARFPKLLATMKKSSKDELADKMERLQRVRDEIGRLDKEIGSIDQWTKSDASKARHMPGSGTRLVPIGDKVYNLHPSMNKRVARDVLKRRHKEAKAELRVTDDPVRTKELLDEISASAPRGTKNRYTNRQIQEVIEKDIAPRTKEVRVHSHFDRERDVLRQIIKENSKEASRLRAAARVVMRADPEIKGAVRESSRLSKAAIKAEKTATAIAKKITSLRKAEEKKLVSLNKKLEASKVKGEKEFKGPDGSMMTTAHAERLIEDYGSKMAADELKGLREFIAKHSSDDTESILKQIADIKSATQKQVRLLADESQKNKVEIGLLRKKIAGLSPAAQKEADVIAKRRRARELSVKARGVEDRLARDEGRYSAGLFGMDGNYMMPKAIVDSIEQAMSSGFDMSRPLHRFLRKYQDFQKIFKIPLTLPFVGYWGRNIVTSVGMTANAIGFKMLDPNNALPVFNTVGHLLFRMQETNFTKLARTLPKPVREAWGRRLDSAKKSFESLELTTKYGDKVSVKELTDEVIKRGVNQGFVYSELAHEPFRKMDGQAHGWMIGVPMDLIRRGVYGITMAGETLTDVPFRVTLFTQEVLDGKSYAEAAESVKKYLNDYSRLSPAEKTVMRTVIPFYSWMQFSLESAFKLSYEKPGSFIVPFKAARGISQHMTEDNPPDYAPNWLNDRIGIWSGPNEKEYYTRVQGFAVNQEEALRQVFAMKDMANLFLFHATKAPIIGGAIEKVFKPADNPADIDQAPLRFLAQMDFGLKFALEGATNQEFFTGSPITVGYNEGTRLESGRGFARLDDPANAFEKGWSLGVGGKWLKSFLEYKEVDGKAKIDPMKRWIVGSTPVSRFVAHYERYIKAYKPGEVNYAQVAAAALGITVYRYNENEGIYYKDRTRIKAVTMLYRNAHLLKDGSFPIKVDIPGVTDADILAPIREIKKVVDEER